MIAGPVKTRRFTSTLCLFASLWFYGCGTDSMDFEENGQIGYPCENGLAMGTYPCDNVDLYAKLSPQELLGERLNDVWGWRDEESGREFALVGLTDGLTFVEVTDPVNPVVIGKLSETASLAGLAGAAAREGRITPMHDDGLKDASIWRDMDVYRNYAVVVSEQPDFNRTETGTIGNGMQIFDLERLLNVENSEMPVTFGHDALYMGFDTAHNVHVHEETGFAYAVGSLNGETCADGGMHMVDLQNPLDPQFAGCYLDERGGGVVADGYIHDTQCVIYRGPDERYQGKEICFNSSELKLLITDVTEKSLPVTLSVSGYNGAAYSHQGWLTEDQRYFLMNDELDERQFGHPTRTYIWDVEDLEEPQLAGFHEHQTDAIDHNLYIRGDYVYQGNYFAGVRILRLAELANARLEESGYFDTTPDRMEREFGGVWSVYPWLSDNTIIASDVHNGLFILKFNGD